MTTVKTEIPVSSLPAQGDYQSLIDSLSSLTEKQRKERLRRWVLSDLYFLIRYVLRRQDFDHPWLFDRCREVQANPDGMLDLWARDHRKSTIITFALTIQDILKDSEITVGIFSHTRPIAKGFLRQIKNEFEQNNFLQDLFPDVLYKNPQSDSPKWSEDDGIVVKRTGNPNAATVEAWGLVDGQPIGKHFRLMIYDDVVTMGSVTTPEQIIKTTDAWSNSLNLADTLECRKRHIGTRYHANDTWAEIIKRGSAKPRIHKATVDGSVSGKAVFISQEALAKKRSDMGPYVFSAQMLLNPVADEAQGFKREWMKYYRNADAKVMNKYLIVDPASGKNAARRVNDYTSMFVVGLAPDQNYYPLDIVRDRMNLTERTAMLMELHRKWTPNGVGYEEYGMQADIAHIQEVQERETYRFIITPLGGSMKKEDRIRRLIPLFEQGRIWFPQTLHRTDRDKKTIDLVSVFVEEEFLPFPVSRHDDMIDTLARILDGDLMAKFPEPKAQTYIPRNQNTGRYAGL